MRAVAGGLLVLSAAVVLAAVRVASRLSRADVDDPTYNALLILAAVVVGTIGLVMAVRGPHPSDPPTAP